MTEPSPDIVDPESGMAESSAVASSARELHPLQTPVQFCKGVGPDRALLLAKLGINVAEDVLFCMPRDVLDLSDVRDPSQLEEGILQTVRGTVVDRDTRRMRNGGAMVGVLLRSGREFVRGVWFNQHWMFNKFKLDDVVLFSGKPKRKDGRWEFSSPLIQWLEIDDCEPDESTVAVLPRYGLTEGLNMGAMRRVTRSVTEQFVEHLPERIPERARKRFKLCGIQDAVRALHLPKTRDEFDAGQRRLLFEDLFEFQLAVALRRRDWRAGEDAPILKTTAKIDSRIRRLFPFEFTAGQNEAIADLTRDLAAGKTMHRLLQADVGAGKTAIAMYGMLVAVANEYQTVLMAPTELLATQHWQTIEKALAHSRVTRTLLTGNLTLSQRKRRLEEIASGEIQLVIGTQAVIQKDIRFKKLGLAIIDEQHKFGVGQRAQFSQAERKPHVLVMTATPIPRSLCLTQFGDLDLTSITDLPPGRVPIKTYRVFNQNLRQRAWNFVRERVREGRQIYVVCPRVGESDELDELPQPTLPFSEPIERPLPKGKKANPIGPVGDNVEGSTEAVFQQLRDHELQGIRVGMVHGRMDPQSKADAMEAFRTGETQVLVSTTVIEVGVDVSNATVMVIQEADRFGLSQLHQLRGRVGRGKHQGYCFLFSDSDTPEVTKRLGAMEAYTDGFKIAEVDFELRGPGDILGTRQHGALPLRFANLVRDQKLIEETRAAAFRMVESGEFDAPEYEQLHHSVLDRFAELMQLPRSG